MHAPPSQCRRLKEFHPDMRFGWLGLPRRHPDDLNAGYFCIVRLRTPRHPGSLIGMRWSDVRNAGPLFGADGMPYRNDWHGEKIPYLDRVLSEQLGWDAHDVFSGDFVAAQFRKRWTQEQEQEAYRRKTLEDAARFQARYDEYVDKMTTLTALEHKKMNIRGEVVTKEDVRAALEQEPEMRDIIEHGVKWDEEVLRQAGLKT